ncbi:hypothetical protein V5O48_006561, partial [Marasmius crinis-equi]
MLGPPRLISFPPELFLKIIKEITSASDVLALTSTCSGLYRTYRLDVVLNIVARFANSRVFALTTSVDREEWPDGAEDPMDTLEEAFRPFLFTGEAYISDRGNLFVKIFLPTFLSKIYEHQPGDIVIEGDQISVVKPNKLEKDKLTGVVSLHWDEECRSKIIKMTAHLIREHWDCPECYNWRFISPANAEAELSVRWPAIDFFRDQRWDIPCPCCVGNAVAFNFMAIEEEDEKE